MKKIIRRIVPEIVPSLHANPIVHQIFAARGITSSQELEYGLNNLLPFQTLRGIDTAVLLLVDALRNQESILIIGDFDADGATSTALAMLALKNLGFAKVSYLIPNRFEYGYGLTKEIVKVAYEKKPELIITVDNGIANHEGVQLAKSLGIKVIITDHHLPGPTLPPADAIVNPNQAEDQFLSKNLAGVGVIFYLMLALRSKLREQGYFVQMQLEAPNMAQFLDLVALGTVADVAKLDHNNRVLVHHGIEHIRKKQLRPGIRALLNIINKNCDNVTASDLGFFIGPRINAAGRLDDMSLGIECLLAEKDDRAQDLAYQLEKLNRERREIEFDMQKQAIRLVNNIKLAQEELPFGLCVYEESWHQGVLGILASRLKDRLYRPVIVFGEANNDEIKGSARSIPDLHIRDILNSIHNKYPELIIRFGGHALAAGLTIKRDNFATFNEIFIAEVASQINSSTLQSYIYSDGELPAQYLLLDFAETLRRLGPWGSGFAEPTFDNIFAVVNQRLVGERHLKMTLQVPQTTQNIDAICFNVDTKMWPNYHCAKVRMVYRLDINKYNGKSSLQLVGEQLEAKN